jgi:Ca-activated chloride channel family protein
MRQRFAPVRAQAARDAADRADPVQPLAVAPVPLSFGQDRRPGIRVPEMRELARVEADRLHEGRNRPRFERRAMLGDLAARLKVLLGTDPEPAYAPLRALLEVLSRETDLDARWAEAHRVLSEFAGGAAAPADRTSSFWKG